MCLDADDRIRPEFVRSLRGALIADRGLGIAYTGLGMIQPDGTTMRAQGWPPEFSWESQSTASVPPSNCIPSACMFRRRMWERAGGFKQEYAPGEDAEFWTRGLSVGFTAKRITNEALFEYRAHAGSASRTRQYIAVDEHMPWMRDHKYPMAAPALVQPQIRSYIRPLVSVIIPVGPGHEQYLIKAIDSVLGQTVRDWELIVINDTGKKFEDDLLRAYPFAHVLADLESYGACFARNRGIEAARAPLVLFLDADDYLRNDALEKMLYAYTESGQYVYSDFGLLREDGSIEPKVTMDYNRVEFLKRQVMHSATALVPTEWAREVNGFDISLPGWEEFDFYMKLAQKGYCGVRVPEALLIYRAYSGTRRKSSWEHEKELRELFRKRYPEGMKMSGCCGGNADSILEAKRILGVMEDVMTSELSSSVDGMVLIEFVGDWSGPVTFKANGREYQGANSPLYKYQHVPEEDAVVLERTGKFKRVQQETPKVKAQEIKAPEPVKVEVTSPEAITETVVEALKEEYDYPPKKQEAPVIEKAVKRTRRHA
jgi:GT2 family glycosyltransferase